MHQVHVRTSVGALAALPSSLAMDQLPHGQRDSAWLTLNINYLCIRRSVPPIDVVLVHTSAAQHEIVPTTTLRSTCLLVLPYTTNSGSPEGARSPLLVSGTHSRACVG